MPFRWIAPLGAVLRRFVTRRPAAALPRSEGKRAVLLGLGTLIGAGAARPVLAQSDQTQAPTREPAPASRRRGGVVVTDYDRGDDDAMFDDALAEAARQHAANGRKVSFEIPPGEYRLTRTVDIRTPMQMRAHGAFLDQGLRWFGMGGAIEGLTIDGAPNFGVQLHRGQGAMFRDITVQNCGGAGLVLGGLKGAQVAWSNFDGIRLLDNGGGLSVGMGEGGLPIGPSRAGEPPSIALLSGGTGYPEGRSIQTVSGGSGTGAMILIRVSDGVVRAADIAHSGDGYEPGDMIAVGGSDDRASLRVDAIQRLKPNRRTNWANANNFTGLWVRGNTRFGIIAHGGPAYNFFQGMHAEANGTGDLAAMEGDWALTKMFGAHIVGGRMGNDVPVVRLSGRKARGNQWYGVRFVQAGFDGPPEAVVDLPRSDRVVNPEYRSARGGKRG